MIALVLTLLHVLWHLVPLALAALGVIEYRRHHGLDWKRFLRRHKDTE